uniref:DnaJ-like protein C11 C-terminal domain-containing protein n=1 Tax=viral metagenome TaxID=1070528 RepID=A0A6C0EP14_9ZZZZ
MSGIIITNATYGTSSASTDVTKTLSASIKDGVLSIPSISPTTLNVADPAPNQAKILHVSYTINGGDGLMTAVNDNNSLYINAPPQRTASGLQITKAEYGVDGNFTDVTDAVQSMLKNGGLDLTVGFKALGLPDPNPNKRKQFEVEYTINGAKNMKTLNDGERFKISAPAVDSPSNQTPSQTVGSVISTLFYSVAYFFAMYLYTLSVFTGIEYGNQFISPMLWGAVCFFLPGFAFWGLPSVTFWVRLFSSADFIH